MIKKTMKAFLIMLSILTFNACNSESIPNNNENIQKPIELKISVESKNNNYNDEDLILFANTGNSEIKSYIWMENHLEIGFENKLIIPAPISIGTHTYKLIVTDTNNITKETEIKIYIKDAKFKLQDNNIKIFAEDLTSDKYILPQIDDNDFNQLSIENKYKISKKILETMFFSYSKKELDELINSGEFISIIKDKILDDVNDINEIEELINDKEKYYQNEYRPEVKILSRFYEMKNLDKTYFDHWMTYILTQTILFSPASELDTVATSDMYGVYNRIFTFINNGISMRYIGFQHMISDENWRRFRSPEDNGREMLEIYALDTNDKDVPIAAQALQNWHLSKDGDTLVIGLNKNTEPLTLLGEMNFKTGKEFYSSLANSSYYTKGVITRIVDFMFLNKTDIEKENIINKILQTNPETWKDIFAQIIFSKEYLFNTERTKSIEEIAFPLFKVFNYNSGYYTFVRLRNYMISMNQASMSYKLGKLNRVPMDFNSFATVQKYIRENIFRKWSRDIDDSIDPDKISDEYNSEIIMNNYKKYEREGISSKLFMIEDNYEVIDDNYEETNKNFINFITNSIIGRELSNEEMDILIEHINSNYFKKYLIYTDDDKDFEKYRRYVGRYYIQYLTLEYLTRIDSLYFYKEVK